MVDENKIKQNQKCHQMLGNPQKVVISCFAQIYHFFSLSLTSVVTRAVTNRAGVLSVKCKQKININFFFHPNKVRVTMKMNLFLMK